MSETRSMPSQRDDGPSDDAADLVLEPLRRGDEREVAQLHTHFFAGEEYGHSVANMGQRFMERVFYGMHFDNPYFFCDVARYGGKVVGFNVFTNDRKRLFRYTIKAHPVTLGLELIRTVFSRPRAVVSLASNMRYAKGESLPVDTDVPGWWLVMGVLPEHRGRDFVERTGHRIASELADRMESTLRKHGCPAWYGAIQPWNEPMKKFMSRRGGRLVGSSTAQGLEALYYVKRLDAQPGREQRPEHRS